MSVTRSLIDFFRSLSFQLSLVQLAMSSSVKENQLQSLRKFCPDIHVEFWTCMNRTIESIDRGSHWIGRSCCSQALLPKCQQGLLLYFMIFQSITVLITLGCAISASTMDLKSFCRQSDELTLFSCIDQMERNTECCSNANSPDCRQVKSQEFSDFQLLIIW